jgi:hypothetical protein
MFRQPYNRGKFNVPSAAISSNSGIALLKLEAVPVSAQRTISASGQASLKLSGLSDGAIVRYAAGSCLFTLGSFANGTKVFIVEAEDATLVMLTQAVHQLSGEQVMRFEDLVLCPGDELVINTCDLTVTLNGLNAMEYFAADSEFITLLNGKNIIEYNDESGTRNISFDIIWKDRWL